MNRIGIVAMSRPALGGTFQYTLSMIDALRSVRKNTYTIFTAENNHSYDELGLPIRRLPSAIRSIFGFLRSRVLSGNGEDVFVGMDKLIAPIYSTRLLASRRPFLFTLHDLQEKYYPANFTFAQRVWRDFVNKSLSHAAGGIICESNHVKSDIQRFLAVNESKISVIPAPPVSAFASGRTAKDVELPAEFLFYPAQFFPHKNHLRLIEAFSRVLKSHPQCHLVLTGQKKYQFDKVIDRARKLGIHDRVIHLGYIDTDVLAAVFMRATLVVIPTLFESISIPVYEAFRMGVPVCASNVVALPEQIGDAGLLFDPLSIDDMTQKISTLLGNPELRAELAEKGKARVSALTMGRYAEQLEAILDGLDAGTEH